MLKNIILSVLFISVIGSPNSNLSIEGVWIASYNQFPERENATEKERLEFNHVLQITGNTYRFKSFENRLRETKGVDITTTYALKNNKIIIDDGASTSWDILIYKDSMTIVYDGNEKIKTTYKRLPKQAKQINWNPSGNLYKSRLNDQKFYEDFVNDSLSYLHFTNQIEVYKQYWQIEHISNYSFLLIESDYDNTVSLIDSIVGNKTYLTDFALDGGKYILEKETKKQKKPAELLGAWKLVNLEDIQEVDEEGTFDPLSRNRIKEIIIEKDSIFIINPMFKQKSSWKYYEDGNLILLEDKMKTAKIVALDENSLVLEMDLTGMHYKKKQFIFMRE